MSTAGGLVFGAVDNNRFHAFDSKTGKGLWAFHKSGAGNADPMTYQGEEWPRVSGDRSWGHVDVCLLP
jgi:quinoprotein glucose dehydrogenase